LDCPQEQTNFISFKESFSSFLRTIFTPWWLSSSTEILVFPADFDLEALIIFLSDLFSRTVSYLNNTYSTILTIFKMPN